VLLQCCRKPTLTWGVRRHRLAVLDHTAHTQSMPGAAADCTLHCATSQALAQLLTPPAPKAVTIAIDRLMALGALSPTDGSSGSSMPFAASPSSAAGEKLTALGLHVSMMPMDARLAKALIYACMLRCLSPMLTIAAAMGYGRPLFMSPPDKRSEADASRRSLLAGAVTAKSDHLAMVAAFNAW
jgi:ATP-dependent RNA helicase DHX57